MKKCRKSIALLAAAALVTGGLFLSCSNSSDDDDESTEEVLNSSGNEADNSGNANSDAENSGNTGDTTGDSGSSTVSETTYNFVGLSETDFSGVTLDKTTVSGYWVFTGEAAVSNGASIYSKSLKNARIGYDDSNVTTKINFNGDGLSNSAVTEGSTVSSCSRYVSVPVTAAGTIVVNCQGSSKDNLGKLVVYNANAKLHHYESKSRGYEDTPEKKARFDKEAMLLRERWPKERIV